MITRPATLKDFSALYRIGKKTKELQVSHTEPFMTKKQLQWSITNKEGVFLVAEDAGKIVGFIYADVEDKDMPFRERYACIIYLVIIPTFRGQGVGTQLYQACEQRLKKLGMTHVYAWANIEAGDSVIHFNKKQGFAEGHKYMWMDKKL